MGFSLQTAAVYLAVMGTCWKGNLCHSGASCPACECPYYDILLLKMRLFKCVFLYRGSKWLAVVELCMTFSVSLGLFYMYVMGLFSLQVRSDWYVYAVMSSLPWVAKELTEKKETEFDKLLLNIEEYLT